MHTTRKTLAATLIILTAVLVGACEGFPDDPPQIGFVNESDTRVKIVAAGSAIGPGSASTLEPMSAVSRRDACIEVALEARLEDGTTVATHPANFCQGDPDWIITQAEVDAAKGTP